MGTIIVAVIVCVIMALLIFAGWGAMKAVDGYHDCLKIIDERERAARKMGAVL